MALGASPRVDVDDHVGAARTMATFVEDLVHRVIVQHGSRIALERARREQPGIRLLDTGLPDIDGNELARQCAE